jgi:hypothetical protein
LTLNIRIATIILHPEKGNPDESQVRKVTGLRLFSRAMAAGRPRKAKPVKAGVAKSWVLAGDYQ